MQTVANVLQPDPTGAPNRNALDQEVQACLPPRLHPPRAALAVYFALSLFAILYIPYFFPVPPSTSDSYIFGYNNRIGILLFLLCVAAGAI